MKRVETSDYILNFETGTCFVKAYQVEVETDLSVMTEMARSYWREEKQSRTYYNRCLSYQNEASDDATFEEFLASPSCFEPENMLRRKKDLEILSRCVEEAPSQYKNVGVLYYFENKTEEEIGRLLGITHQAVNYRKKKFLKNVQKKRESLEMELPGSPFFCTPFFHIFVLFQIESD